MLICVESGMSIEAAIRKVADEIGGQSVGLAEELILTNAELSYLPERRQAYENLNARTGLESVKSVTQALIQAERYGTPVAHALRVLASESRDMRMNEAEKKAAALPPKLTVPMILFFLPGAVRDHSRARRHPGQPARRHLRRRPEDDAGIEHIRRKSGNRSSVR